MKQSLRKLTDADFARLADQTGLNARSREAARLHLVEGQSLREVGRLFGVSSTSIEKYVRSIQRQFEVGAHQVDGDIEVTLLVPAAFSNELAMLVHDINQIGWGPARAAAINAAGRALHAVRTALRNDSSLGASLGVMTPSLNREWMESSEYVLGYLEECGGRDPMALLAVAADSQKRSGVTNTGLAADIPFALGWAHARGWLQQIEINARIDTEGYGGNPGLMFWEMGRCEALAALATTDAEREAVWSLCRVRHTAPQTATPA